MSPVAMADNPALLDPMHALDGAERTFLRKLYREGPAIAIGFNKGWMLGGVRIAPKAIQRFERHGLTRSWRDPDGVKFGLTYSGRLAAERITPSKPGPAAFQED